MQVRKETVLNVFPGADDQHRLVVAVEQIGDDKSQLVLRQESHSADVGWFVQSRVCIESGQVAGLKMALSGGRSPAIGSSPRDVRSMPAILRFDEAVTNQAS